ncbi:MAG: PIN domain-containing protein, partial [Pseudomonadota bacterium]
MRVLIDTCVLYPTVMREMVLGSAETGAFEPKWSARIEEEWARASRKLGPTGEAQARAEIALVRGRFANTQIRVPEGLEARLWLPDAGDIHVLAAAVAGSADAIMTLNAKDFPRHILAEEGLKRIDPDAFLVDLWQAMPEQIEAVGGRV